jgi:TonB-linked SusC/RagA family outer membrane protein
MISWLVCASIVTYAQDRTVTGKVTDEQGQAMPGVSVVIDQTNRGTVTGVDGSFTLDVPTGSETLVFSFIGYTTQRVSIGNQTTVSVTMEEDVTQLQEVVVTGAFGVEQERKSLGYSVQTLNGEEITKVQQPNLVNALQGQVAGVQVTNSGGAPGMSARILIRGVTSLNPGGDNQPLFVVDGIQIDNSTFESSGTPRGLSNRVADLNPNDIESVNVLKGAAATALYGVRAANGAVIITTKKGKSGQLQVNFKTSVGFEEVNHYPEYQQKYGQGFSGEYQPTSFWPSYGAPVGAVQQINPEYRMYETTKETMETGTIFDNYLSVSGGGENSTIFASISYFDQQGVIPFSDWSRVSAKLSGSVDLGKLEMQGSMIYTNSGGMRVPHDRIMETLQYWSYSTDPNDYINPDGSQNTYGNTNPLYAARFQTYEDNVDRFIGNINLKYNVAPWLNLNYRLGLDTYSDQREEILPGPLGVANEIPLSSTGFIEETRINSRNLTSTFIATFNKDITDRLNATFRVGNDVFDLERNTIVATGNEFVVPRFYHLSNVTEQLTGQTINQRRLIGVYGDLSLNYDDFLFLNITGRNDWSSTLPKENRSFFYSSYNLGFVFSDLWDMPDFISYGKFRASYAEVGKDTDPYQTQLVYTTTDPLNGQVGFTRSNVLGSNELTPERTSSIEFGLEMNMLENRIGFDLTWYKSNSADQILQVPVSNATGYTRLILNAGELENKGIELVLRGTPVVTPDFRWDATLNFTRNRNTVVDIRDGIESIVVGSQFGYVGATTTMQLIEGDPYGNLYGTSYERYYPDGKPEGLTTLDRDRALVIGADGFPVRNGEQLIIGNAQPDWIAGLQNTLTYKDFTLSFLIDARVGVDQYSQFDNFYAAFGQLDYSLDRNAVVVFDGVQSDGSRNDIPVWLGQGIGPDGNDYGASFYRNDFRGVSENFVQDASFVKLRNISLQYNLGQNLISKTPFRAASLSVSANNIILWTPWQSFDPESFSAGAGGNATAFTGLGYPGVRSYFVTLNLSL